MEPPDEFDIVSPETIRAGEATDAYFERTVETLEYAGENPRVTAEVTADQFPTGEFEVFSGIEDAATLLAGHDTGPDHDIEPDHDTGLDHDTGIDVDGLAEGRLFDGGPVLRIEGRYLDFARFETALLGFLSQASGMATNALRARRAAPDSSVLSFGARHVHPSIGAVVERSALVGGFDGFSHTAAGEILGREASGTMPHALLICFGQGNQEAAWTAFNEAVSPEVPRIALCDTYSDEVREVLRAANALGEDLDSVRIDTTSSRRGDIRHILREVRWELAARGREDVDIFVSGGLEPADLRELRDVADGFGVGGYVSNAEPVDFALDIVELEGEPAAKRGKLSGKKQVHRTLEGGHAIRLADHEAPIDGEELLEPLVRDGELVREFDLDAAARRASTDADAVGFDRE